MENLREEDKRPVCMKVEISKTLMEHVQSMSMCVLQTVDAGQVDEECEGCRLQLQGQGCTVVVTGAVMASPGRCVGLVCVCGSRV